MQRAETEIERGLLIEEYKSCRELIGRNIDIIEKSEVYAIGACAAIFVFVLGVSDPLLYRIAAWLPLVVSILGLIRYIGIDSTIHKINDYLEKVEAEYTCIGWTTFYRAANTDKILKKSRYSFWGGLILVSLVGGALNQYVKPDAHPGKVDAVTMPSAAN
ncbi:hypothetical protein EN866_19440 [Mesorhizobium sp. M2D.F.Ca.ET.223.01.1.1]|uniref:hypothetical protein n=1 Tax=unclassified Mesorhizobium TaxID=325217 RepID=UPI000FCC22C0|nr:MULTISPECIES: hypothetical protein [unclassified Mesorhizobium]TGP89335.1 hypothetical protein EN864_19450 [bacterium M00.F.Ca.ET.221.01.1.1]TGP94708.1 hypothetical protein EN865_15320 [bacterium M00.F.Ca.ET.222.01.1.1]RVD58878.1 hypothetical protein EN783_14675 [Mesorhizobium sp. M2D.F.Ca.ET.140.01.1.1]TGP27907.1 hypothetical protein EN875_033160 [Mesorhizobium sp. M2D.F.Ca.ET.232.01.1.1]TGP75876.1 hypothetical protein EN867_15320 [Mesorhizobium sp. M2D.F.Ca.ET.224.01.1.1]